VDASAQVIGHVEIGAESSVWMNVVVRGDVNSIRIGRRTNVQDGTIVHVMNDTHPTRSAMTSRLATGPSCTAARLAIAC
jgi:carbonic anhydrase/acetyltransferase-like protein (isoleucine patch superfamily)